MSGAPGLPSSDDVTFTWRYTRQLDSQYRVACPPEWRPKEAEMEFFLIVWPHVESKRDEAYIKGLTQRKYDELKAKVSSMQMGTGTPEVLRRQIFTNTLKLKLDQAGRFCLNRDICEAVGIKKDVYFEGLGDQFGLWDPARHAECRAADRHLVVSAYSLI